MILSAQLLDTLDRCARRVAFEREWESRSISPLGLLYAGVEGSLTATDPIYGATGAIREKASHLEVNAGELSPLSAVRHVESMAQTIALALRMKLGQGARPEPIKMGDHEWQSNLFECRGELHRIVLCSHLDDDSLRSFAHAWQTVGELAALERPLTLTMVIVGAQRGGRRHSHWAKCFQHPVQKSALRFSARNRDDGFTKGWKPVWREQTSINAETWLDRMRSDGVLEELIVSRRIQFNGSDERMKQARNDILRLAELAGASRTSDPMRRSSCDEIGKSPCSFSACCYSPTAATPEDFPGLYRHRE